VTEFYITVAEREKEGERRFKILSFSLSVPEKTYHSSLFLNTRKKGRRGEKEHSPLGYLCDSRLRRKREKREVLSLPLSKGKRKKEGGRSTATSP